MSELNIFTNEKLISDEIWPTGWLFYTHVEIKNGSNQKIIVLCNIILLCSIGKSCSNNYWHDSDILKYLPSVTPEAWLLFLQIENFDLMPNYFSCLVEEFESSQLYLTHFEKYINYFTRLKPMREKKSTCKWSTFSEFSYFSWESYWWRGHVPSYYAPVFVLNITLKNVIGTSADIFRYYRTPTKKTWHFQHKNVMPIN